MGWFIEQNTEDPFISSFNFSPEVAADLMLVSGQDEKHSAVTVGEFCSE